MRWGAISSLFSAAWSPKRTAEDEVKFRPMMVTSVPPAAGPLAGTIDGRSKGNVG